MDSMEIVVFNSHYLMDETGRCRSFSSEPEYDEAMSSVFNYFALVTVEEARELSGVLSRGYNRQVLTPTENRARNAN
ncbi:hypothetical protein [Pseudarthrobacter sp. S9]|uniref:hypothetical protein n=1 Tax=Pseudarthrobacter sp. S9 TaxID=3418421 RepID=UPI003D05FA16